MKRFWAVLLWGCAASNPALLVQEGLATREIEVCSLAFDFDAPGQGHLSASVRAPGTAASPAVAVFDWGVESHGERVAQGRVVAKPELVDGCVAFEALFVVREQNWRTGLPGRENAVFNGVMRTADSASSFSKALRLEGTTAR